MITLFRCRAISIARADFPLAVGPAMIRTGFTVNHFFFFSFSATNRTSSSRLSSSSTEPRPLVSAL